MFDNFNQFMLYFRKGGKKEKMIKKIFQYIIILLFSYILIISIINIYQQRRKDTAGQRPTGIDILGE